MGFKKDFVWGAATASYQIEGGAFEDGRGLSVWDQFSHTPGKVYHDHNGNVACDHYHRFRDDVKMMAEMGIRNYRFSVAWPRILPEGTGQVNEKGVAFYNALIDELLANGIRPFMTLFHWDYPTPLQERGGWANPDSVRWFADYVAVCARAFGDRVKDFLTLNEPPCFIGLGYKTGGHAPGFMLPDFATIPMSHHVMQAHGEAVRVLRALVPDCRIGYAPNGSVPIPVTNDAADVEAARRRYFEVDRDQWIWSVSWWSDPVMLGRYPEEGLKHFEAYLPKGWEKDLPGMHEPLDYYAQNIYYGMMCRAADNEKGWEEVKLPTGHAKTAVNWPVTPDALYWGPKFLYERYKTPILITENGMAANDVVSLDGKVHDPERQDFMHRYLRAYKRAAEDGIDLAGYFAWSLMDNYEWEKGYAERFGMVYVDYQTQQRIVKDSAWWYQDIMKHNGENL